MSRKKKIGLFVVLAVVITLLFASSVIFKQLTIKNMEKSNIKYPASTLSDNVSDYDYSQLHLWENQWQIPGARAYVSLPDRDISVTSSSLAFDYKYYDIVISSKDCLDFTQAVTDTGYFGEYEASYFAGYSDDGFYIAYSIIFNDDTYYFCAKSSKVIYLQDQKTMVDTIISSLTDEKTATVSGTEALDNNDTETVSAEELVPDTETESAEISNDPHNSWITETSIMGDEYYYTEKDVEVSTDENRDNYVVFTWLEVNSYPTETYLVSPEGHKYYSDVDESMGASIVFHVQDAIDGTYVLHVRTRDSLGKCQVNSYTKSAYMMIFYNQDENGEPYHYNEGYED